ncbi:3'(2'),5'-bisphosphate nucleotidase CysQ family protein [Gloeothece citriformis]|uniref:3'(2'),5'-bisphosphate nucleotidase CysQ family protein n=1 Tax=Gloeothece citriformis TaxID=2546356 RepID=UPI0006765064
MTTVNIETPEKLEEITQVLRSVAWGASDILQSYYRGEDPDKKLNVQEDKKDGPVTAADLATNHYILEKLQAVFSEEEFGYLSEETHKGDEPIRKDWVWIIDPLDGTRDFIDKTGEYAIHIALAYQGRPMVAVVAVPEADKIYIASKGNGTTVEKRNGETYSVHVSQRNKIEELYLVASRTHRDQRFQDMLDRMPFKARNYVGSVGCKISTILEQQSDVYISLSGKSAPKDWDFAAPELILTEAGGTFTHFSGEPLTYNKGDVRQWGGLMASNGRCHEELCQLATSILADIDG